jgi:RNA polymerase sigma-70 factor (ECF subfamily)
MSGSRQAAPDLVQEAFVRAVRRVGTFRGDGSIEAWVSRIVINVARSAGRETQTARLVHELAATPAAAGAPTDVSEAISRLSERQRLVLFLRYYGDLDYKTIAEALGISSGTVGATLTTARAALAEELERKEAYS